MIKKDNCGYYFESEKTGRRYEILECVSVGTIHKYTSDILAIVWTGNVDTYEPSEIIGHYWGALGFEPDEDNEKYINDIVTRYENENAFYVNTDEPTDIVTLETIRKRYIEINGSDNGFIEYVRKDFYDGLYPEYRKIEL